MIDSKHFRWFGVLHLCILMFSGLNYGNSGYKIVSFAGKVKVKVNGEMHEIKEISRIPAIYDSLMVYPGSTVNVQLPGNIATALDGPFYSTVDRLTKWVGKDSFSFLKNEKLWTGIADILDAEGEDVVSHSRGTTPTSDENFFNEINKALSPLKVKEDCITQIQKEKLIAELRAVEQVFNAFSEPRIMLVKSLIYKDFGLHDRALRMVYNYYDKNYKNKNMKRDIDAIENILYNELIPIVIRIHPEVPMGPLLNKNCRIPAKPSPRKFSANFTLWWASFYYDGKTLQEIELTTDSFMELRDTFEINKEISIDKNNPGCIFIIGCSSWSDIEELKNIDAAKKELLRDDISESNNLSSQTGYRKVIIKISL